MKTRAKKPTAGKKDENETKATVKTLEPSVETPPQLFVLPKDVSREARLVTLPNPANSKPSRYLLCPEKGCYEFTRVSAPKRACKSWLLAPEHASTTCGTDTGENSDQNQGYVLNTPDLMIATPIDLLFIILPALTQDVTETGRQEYLQASDYLEKLERRCEHFKELMLIHGPDSRLEQLFEARMLAVCAEMDAGDEKLCRLSRSKLLNELLAKARKMIEHGLPPSMEERFVKEALAVPVLSIRREESSVSMADERSTTGGAESDTTSASTSQDTEANSAPTETSVTTAATSIPDAEPAGPSNEIMHLLRLRVALNFLLDSYVPETLRSGLRSLIDGGASSVDFAPLDKHLEHINNLKKEAQALRSLSDNINRKRSAMDDDDAMEKAEAKKRKKEEEELKKKNMSRGVQQLKKADTSGMKKLSSFFSKAPANKTG